MSPDRDPASWRQQRAQGVPNREADLDEEIRFHLDMRQEEYLVGGATTDEARRRALRKFGDVLDVRGQTLAIDQRRYRRASRIDVMTSLIQDIRYALRSIRLTPGFSAMVAITLALGIGLTTVMFSVVDHVLLRPLPYASPERLLALADVQPGTPDPTPLAYPEYLDWTQRSGDALSQVAAWFQASATLTGSGEPEALFGERISANVPTLLGVAPLLGRSFHADEELPASERVVMLSEPFWRRRFASDPGVLGRVLTLNGQPFTVIGVFPAAARARLPNELMNGRRTDFWAPLRLTDQNAPRGLHFMFAMGQLRPGVDLAQARLRLAAMSAGLERDGVSTHKVQALPLANRLVGDAGGLLQLLVASVAMLLLIACANVANLLLARSAARQREFTIRAALGAGRRRILSQLLAESVVRAVTGGALGVAVAYGVNWAMRRFLVVRLPRYEQVAIDGRVLAFAVGLSVLTGLAFGLVPGLRASRGDMRAALHEGGRGVFGSIRRDRFRRALVIGEVALSFVLLVGAGLLMKSFGLLLAVPLGFDPERIVTAFAALPASRYRDSTQQRAFFRQALESMSALPGVTGATFASNLPIEGGTNGGVQIEGRDFGPDEGPVAEKRIVSVNYFQVMRAKAVAGRLFDSRDVPGGPPVVIVNQAFARRWFPDADPIGKRVDFAWGTEGMQTVVGVVADVREGALDQAIAPSIYIPVEHRTSDGMYLIVRSTIDATSLMGAVQRKVHEIDRDLPLSEVRSLSAVMKTSVAGHTLTASILGTFAVLALVLAGVGLYGVISYSVVQRTQELGIRAALGAQRGNLMGLVLRQGLGFVAAGFAIGLAASLGFGKLIAKQLYGIGPTDPATFALVAALLAAVALLATAVPALRATRADPLRALRQE